MTDDLRAKLLAFLAAEFSRKDHRQCIRLELSHAQVGYRGDVLRTWDRAETPDLFELKNTEELASEIVKLARDEADNFPTRQRFVLRTEQYLAGGRAKHTFMMEPEYSGDDETQAIIGASGEVSAAPTVANVLAMQMRHNERMMQMNAQTFQGSLQAALRQNQMLVDENMQLRKERAEMMKELEESRSQKDQRELAALAQVASDNRKDKAIGKLLQLAPVVAAKIAGKDGMPGAPTPLSILVSELAKSLSAQQFNRIASALTTEQKILLGEAIKTAKASEPPPEESKESASPAPASNNS